MLRRIKRAADSRNRFMWVPMEASAPSDRQAHVGPTDATFWLPHKLLHSEFRCAQNAANTSVSFQSNFPERVAAHASQAEADILQGEGVGSPIF